MPAISRVRVVGAGALVVATAMVWTQLPGIAAGALLHPGKNTSIPPAPASCSDISLQGAGVVLRGWHCATDRPFLGTVIYLHGIADNRASSAGAIDRLLGLGFDVIAYDSRAHGLSDGDFCTYGYLEQQDLRRVIDNVREGPVILMGTSLGAAVALQASSRNPRVTGIIAAEIFSDLESVAAERAWFVPGAIRKRALDAAGRRAGFEVSRVSPVEAAATVTAAVLLLHGAADVDTSPMHSEKVHAALAGRKRFIRVAGAAHNQSLSGSEVWREIDAWLLSLNTKAASF